MYIQKKVTCSAVSVISVTIGTEKLYLWAHLLSRICYQCDNRHWKTIATPSRTYELNWQYVLLEHAWGQFGALDQLQQNYRRGINKCWPHFSANLLSATHGTGKLYRNRVLSAKSSPQIFCNKSLNFQNFRPTVWEKSAKNIHILRRKV